MKTYYAMVSVAGRRLGTYVFAEDIAGAFDTATAKYKRRHRRLHVETIAVQEMGAQHSDTALVAGPLKRRSSGGIDCYRN